MIFWDMPDGKKYGNFLDMPVGKKYEKKPLRGKYERLRNTSFFGHACRQEIRKKAASREIREIER